MTLADEPHDRDDLSGDDVSAADASAEDAPAEEAPLADTSVDGSKKKAARDAASAAKKKSAKKRSAKKRSASKSASASSTAKKSAAAQKTPGQQGPESSPLSSDTPDVAETAAEPTEQQRIAHYRLQSVAAEGGMGTVYSAIDETLDRRVALKVIEDQEQAQRLIQEARNVSKLNHPGIAGVYQAGVDEATGIAFIAFEWVDGLPLRHELREGSLPLARFDAYAKDIAAAVAHAHSENLIHGDLKADNVVATRDGRLKLLDFGLSAPAEEIADGDLWGTPAYMSLELLEGAPRNEATDLFALGVLLYEMATGSLPFGGADGDERGVRQRLRQGETPDPRVHRPELPAVWGEVITQLLQGDPKDRGPSAAEIERMARLRLRGDTRSALRWMGPLLLVGLAALGWWTRERWWPSDSGTAEDVTTVEDQRPLRYRLGEWRDPQNGELTAESELGRDLLTLFLNGDDPGSAFLTEQQLPLGADELRLSGTWGKIDGKWRASWGEGEQLQSIEAEQPVQLAQRVAQSVLLAEGGRPKLQRIADTLTLRERALLSFLGALRKIPSGDLLQARQQFADARREAGSFPEASAWEAALALVAGDHDAATRTMASHMRIASQPGSVLVDFLGVPMRRDRRWQASHRLAGLLDLVLDGYDPRTPESELRLQLENHGQGPFPLLPEMSARLALTRGEVDAAADALHRMRSLSAPPWRVAVLERWVLIVQGERRRGDEELEEWLLDNGRAPGTFLRVPLAFYKNNLRSALKRARGLQSSLPEARQVAALTFAIGDQSKLAGEIVRTVTSESDPGLAERLRAALAMLEGDNSAATEALQRALEIDPDRPEPQFLLRFIEEDPFLLRITDEEVATDAEPASRSHFSRWRDEFLLLGEVRRLCSSGDADAALKRLGEVSWVTADLRVREWPEAVFLQWLERVRVYEALGERERATDDFERFREWWPAERAPGARISTEAAEVEALLGV